MVVHQLLSGAGPVDAVTGQALAFRALFDAWGWEGDDFAVHIDPRMDGRVRPLSGLEPAADDVLLVHYSAYAPKLRPALATGNPKLLVSHNVTPAKYLWGYEPTVALHCALGRAQLPDFAEAVDLAAGVSAYNVSELEEAGARRTAVIPVLFDRSRLGDPASGRPDGPPTILYVARLTPHKRQDEVLRVFALYRRWREPEARLVLVGEPLSPRYGRALRELADELVPGAVEIEGGLAPEELWERYRSAHAFLCLSEHEGFCIPLLEAFHFGVPVVARAVGGVPEVAGDAALLVPDREDDRGVIAELLHLAVRDEELRSELRARGQRRLDAFRFEDTARRLREAVESVAA